MKTISSIRILSALVLLPLGLATACAVDSSDACHEVADVDGTTSEVCGCQDEVDEDGNESTLCEGESIGSTEEALGIACGMKSGGVVNVGSCICYAETKLGLVEVGRGMDCFVR